MEILPLSTLLESVFWEFVNQDIPHYFFFAFDWKYNRDKSKILLALKENRIEGMMLIYDERIVLLRGGCEAARILLERLELEEVELQAPKEHKQYVLEKYRSTVSHELMLMLLRNGEENLQTMHPIVRLNASDAEQIATIMGKADPEFWGDVKVDQIIEGMDSVNSVGIKDNGKLVSIGRSRLTNWVGQVMTVATLEAHRNKGYATSITSHLVKLILKRTPTAIIYVLCDNPAAISVYEKVGFKPYKTYFFIRGKRR
jgi:predicted GNAT family acetyltransferase